MNFDIIHNLSRGDPLKNPYNEHFLLKTTTLLNMKKKIRNKLRPDFLEIRRKLNNLSYREKGALIVQDRCLLSFANSVVILHFLI